MSERKMIYLCLAHMSEDGIEQKYVQEAFDTNWVVPMGPNVNAFEKDLERFIEAASHLPSLQGGDGGRRVVCLSAGTAAVHLALIACGVKAGDEVCVQSFTFCASSHPITYLGAKPVFVGSEGETWNMDPELLEEAIKDRIAKTGKKPKAIIPVALYGMPYRIDEIMAIADKYGIPVIEDAAEGMGSRFNGQVLGTFGRFGVLSFNGNKMITTSGGGALICNGSLSPDPSPKGKGSVNTADKAWYGLLKDFAEENRNKPTEAESVLWNALKAKGMAPEPAEGSEESLGAFKFRRQHIIDDFIVDFFCADKGLTIEVDGGYHNYPPQMKLDAERTKALSELGYIELRFTNEEVLCDTDGVLQKISNFCNALPSRKSHPSGGDLERADEQWQEIMWYATQARDAYPYYQHSAIGFNYRMSNVCAGIGRGQMTVLNNHIAHHKHVQALYEELLAEVPGIHIHKQPDLPSLEGGAGGRLFDSNYWLCAATIDLDVKVKGQENAYKEVVKTAVGGAAGVIHAVDSATTDCQPNDNVEALRVFMLDRKVECRPLWKPMHCQPVYRQGEVKSEKLKVKNEEVLCLTSDASVAYTRGIEEELFKVGFCLPAGPYVTDDDVRYIVDCIKEAIV